MNNRLQKRRPRPPERGEVNGEKRWNDTEGAERREPARLTRPN